MGKAIGILLVILNLALFGSIGFFYYQQDSVSPRIVVSDTSLVYENGMEEELLLEGVTAYDNVDGDITERIVIEKVVTDTRKESATITYGVVDTAGNISKTTRTVAMKVEEEIPEVPIEEITEAVAENETSVEENQEEAQTEEENTEEQDNESESQTITKKPAVQTNTSSAQTTKKPAQTNKPTTQTASQANSGRPSIKFKGTTIKTSVGGGPAWVNIIEGLYDDKDNYATLFGTMKVSGEYNKNKPGTYRVHVTVTDSDGNVSNAYPIDIVVE